MRVEFGRDVKPRLLFLVELAWALCPKVNWNKLDFADPVALGA